MDGNELADILEDPTQTRFSYDELRRLLDSTCSSVGLPYEKAERLTRHIFLFMNDPKYGGLLANSKPRYTRYRDRNENVITITEFVSKEEIGYIIKTTEDSEEDSLRTREIASKPVYTIH